MKLLLGEKKEQKTKKITLGNVEPIYYWVFTNFLFATERYFLFIGVKNISFSFKSVSE